MYVCVCVYEGMSYWSDDKVSSNELCNVYYEVHNVQKYNMRDELKADLITLMCQNEKQNKA